MLRETRILNFIVISKQVFTEIKDRKFVRYLSDICPIFVRYRVQFNETHYCPLLVNSSHSTLLTIYISVIYRKHIKAVKSYIPLYFIVISRIPTESRKSALQVSVGPIFIICPVININKSDSYSFSNDETGVEGRYEGELGYGNNWTKFANGWGVFSWDTMESSMGTFKNDYLQEGLLIESDGTQYFGTFKDGRLDKVTEKRDVIGNPISR